MKTTNKKLIATVLIVVVLWLIAGGSFVFVWNKLQKTNSKIEDTKVEMLKQSNVSSLKKITEDNSKAILDLKARIVPSDGDVDLINNLENLGKMAKVNFTVESIVEQEISNTAVSQTMSRTIEESKIRLTAKGSWNSVLKVWSLLESYKYDIVFSAVDLNLTSAENPKAKTTPVWSAVFDIKILKYK